MTVKLYNKIIELSDEKYKTYPPTFMIVKGDTLNRKDKYGLKQGIWIDEKAIKKVVGDTLKPTNYNLDQIIWTEQSIPFFRYIDEKFFTSGHLYLNLKVKDEYNSKTGLRQEFYRNGKIRSECFDSSGKSRNCRQWEMNGQEIK